MQYKIPPSKQRLKLVRIGWLSLLLMCPGCGTMMSHFGDCGSRPPAGVYKGVVWDGSCVAAPFASKSESIGPAAIGLVPIGIIDFPFSFVADTIILPFDVADCVDRQKEQQTRKPAQPKQSAETNPEGLEPKSNPQPGDKK